MGESPGIGQVQALLQELFLPGSRIPPEVKARWSEEELCRRCGRCCFSGVRVKGRMILLRDLPCKFLAFSPEGRAECRIYNKRDAVSWCHRVSVEAVRRELFPPDCPYMKGIPGYKGKVEVSEQEFEELKPALKNIFKLAERPEYVRPSDWNAFLEKRLGLVPRK